jgi:hypothetical protein
MKVLLPGKIVAATAVLLALGGSSLGAVLWADDSGLGRKAGFRERFGSPRAGRSALCALAVHHAAGLPGTAQERLFHERAEELFKRAEKSLDANDFPKAIPMLLALAQKYGDTESGKRAIEMTKPGGVLAFRKLLTTGPEDSRIDVVFVSEGYTIALEKAGKKGQDQKWRRNRQRERPRPVLQGCAARAHHHAR